ncbi:MAG: sugar phosphate isomerase/epimerase [Phycisphaerales bacterium]|nr:sugar phosphate isomerase/epimerase [Phycisphaerales bacterium]
MQLAFSTNAFSRHSLSDALIAIAAAGYTGVEILADKPHWYPDHFNPADAEKIRSQLDQLKLQISNINANCTFGYWQDAPPEPFFEPSLISPNPAHRADRIRMIQNTLQFAHALNADCISITTGKALPTMPPAAATKQLHESLKPILELAEKLQIKIGIECEPGLFIEHAHELRELIDHFKGGGLGANLDIGHAIVIGEPIPEILKLLQGRIWNCHIEDIHHRKHYHLIPGQGTLDWHALKESLLAIKYDRFLTVELYTYPDRPKEAAEQSLAYLQTIFSQ